MIIITGASKGLGKAIANRFVKNGEEVVGLVRSKKKSKIELIQCDVKNYTSIKEASRIIKQKKKILKHS